MIKNLKGLAPKQVWINAGIIASSAFAIRLVYLHGFIRSPFYSFLFLDPKWHDEWAREIASGNWVGNDVFFRAPLYPYFLAVIYQITGGSLLAARLVQFSLGAISAALVYLIGRKLFQRELLGIISGLVFGFYGTLIYFEGELLMPSLIVFLNLMGLLFLYNALEKESPWYFSASGLVFGLSAITRPDVMLPVIGLTLWILMDRKKQLSKVVLRKAMPFFLSAALFPAAVTIRNGIVGGDYVFISSQGGINFFIGNNQDADGKSSVTPGNIYAAPGDKYRDSVWYSSVVIAEQIAGRKLKPSEVSRFWYELAFKWMVNNPSKAALLLERKLYYLFHGHEIPSNNVAYFARNYSMVLSLLLWDRVIAFPAGVVIPLSVMGMILVWPERRKWAPLYIYVALYGVAIVMYFVVARYRMPLVGPFILFAVHGIRQMGDMIVEKRWKKLLLVFPVLGVMIFLSNVNAFDVRNDYLARPLINVGNYYNQRGQLEKAEYYYNEALRLYPEHYMALENLAILAVKYGDYIKAEQLYRRAIIQLPNDPELHNGLGLVLELEENLAEAEIEYTRALLIDPQYGLASSNLARIREKLSESQH